MKLKLIIGIYILMVGLVGCANQEEDNFWYEQYKEMETKYHQNTLEGLNWNCIGWANKTILNSEWFDNCCIGINKNLTSKDKQKMYSAGGICFDGSEAYASVSIGNQTINMSLCYDTPKMIETNETICVLKERQ